MREGIEILHELTINEEDFDITTFKVKADEIYKNIISRHLIIRIANSSFIQEMLINEFDKGLVMGRKYYGVLGDYNYSKLGKEIASKHLNSLIIGGLVDQNDGSLIIH